MDNVYVNDIVHLETKINIMKVGTQNIAGSFCENGKESDFEMSIFPAFFSNEKKYSWIEETNLIFLSKEVKRKLEKINQSEHGYSMFWGYGKDYLGTFTLCLESYSNSDDSLKEEEVEFKEVIILKKYDNNKPHGYLIIYIGEKNDVGDIVGKWHIQQSSGDFKIFLSQKTEASVEV